MRSERTRTGSTASVDTARSVAGAPGRRAGWRTYERCAAKFSHSGMDAVPQSSYRARSGMRGCCAPAIPLAVLAVLAAPARAAECSNADAVKVPGAEMQKSACLDDLTTAGTRQHRHTDASGWAGLTPTEQRNPSGVGGLQVDGYFPDTSTFNTENGWSHDAQFVMRFPDKWNGKLLITGAPGIRKQYSVDPVFSDWALARGYAYASTDKGNSGVEFFRDGAAPGDAILEWDQRVTQLTLAAKQAVRARYGREAGRTY